MELLWIIPICLLCLLLFTLVQGEKQFHSEHLDCTSCPSSCKLEEKIEIQSQRHE